MSTHDTLALAERDSVRAFIEALEGLCSVFTMLDLDESYFKMSARDIRKQCSVSLVTLASQSRAVEPLRAIRAACRRFVSEAHTELADFFADLGALRATIGAQIAVLAALYNIDPPVELAAILPAEDLDEVEAGTVSASHHSPSSASMGRSFSASKSVGHPTQPHTG